MLELLDLMLGLFKFVVCCKFWFTLRLLCGLLRYVLVFILFGLFWLVDVGLVWDLATFGFCGVVAVEFGCL